jgi:hypothetical protein
VTLLRKTLVASLATTVHGQFMDKLMVTSLAKSLTYDDNDNEEL